MYKSIIALTVVLALLHCPAAAKTIDLSREDAPQTDQAMMVRANLNSVQEVFNTSDPRANILRFKYDERTTWKIRLREFMSTVIKLPENEFLTSYVLGDDYNFSLTPVILNAERTANSFAVYATNPGSDTNLVVFGSSGLIYSFYLRCDTVKSDQNPTLVVYIEKKGLQLPAEIKEVSEDEPCQECLKDNPPVKQKETDGEYLRSLPDIKISSLNFSYTTSKGDSSLSPIRIFDDGHFTYFQFEDSVKLPVIYQVLDGYDTPTNSRVEITKEENTVKYRTIIAETINDKWTLRSNEKFLCVRSTK